MNFWTMTYNRSWCKFSVFIRWIGQHNVHRVNLLSLRLFTFISRTVNLECVLYCSCIFLVCKPFNVKGINSIYAFALAIRTWYSFIQIVYFYWVVLFLWTQKDNIELNKFAVFCFVIWHDGKISVGICNSSCRDSWRQPCRCIVSLHP